MPLITVLMTVYNGGQYLRGAVESVLSQAYSDFEFLIINDCSTDESLSIIESFEDPRIRIYTNERNIGQTASLNVGLKLAKGEYVARMDADDIAFPHWLEQQVLFLRRNPGYAVISANVLVIDELNQAQRSLNVPVDEQEIILRSLTRSPINHVSSIMSKAVILKNGGYDENYKIAADYALWGKLLRNKEKLTTNNKTLAAIRMHVQSASIMEKKEREQLEVSRVMGENINYFAKTKVSSEEIKILYETFYKTESLSDCELEVAIQILKKISECLQHLAGFNKAVVCCWFKKQKKIAYFKRIFFHVRLREYIMVRKISFRGIKECGPISMLSGFFFVSLFGNFFLSKILIFFDKFNRQRARSHLSVLSHVKIL